MSRFGTEKDEDSSDMPATILAGTFPEVAIQIGYPAAKTRSIMALAERLHHEGMRAHEIRPCIAR